MEYVQASVRECVFANSSRIQERREMALNCYWRREVVQFVDQVWLLALMKQIVVSEARNAFYLYTCI